MKQTRHHICLSTWLIMSILTTAIQVTGQRIELNFPDVSFKPGFNLVDQDEYRVRVIHSIPHLSLNDVEVDGVQMKMPEMEGIFLPTDEGAPNLPGHGRYIALPQGATANLKLHAIRKKVVDNIDIVPSPNIPLADDDAPLKYQKDKDIYHRDAFYPKEPFRLSEPTSIRGVDVVMLGITPFQYNPVSRQLVIFYEVELEIEFEGGSVIFGDNRLRSRWWDPVLRDVILNSDMLPDIDYSERIREVLENNRHGYEYIIIVPDHPDFIAWADSIRIFRTRQGILTQVMTTTQIGGNNQISIKNYLANAYFYWDIPPAAVLFLADYGNSSTTIISEIRSDHPAGAGVPYISDNFFGDMNNNDLPDIVMARITARNSNELRCMVPKFMYYEKVPPVNPDFYLHPVTSFGWETDRWFQLCAETVNGFWEFRLNKQPLRQNKIYNGVPGTIWSTNVNTPMLVNVFGPQGLRYIPETTAHLNLYGWNASSTTLNNAINSGAFMVLHRDHGGVTGWGEPNYQITHLSGLSNPGLPYVFSVNCLTGKFDVPGESFAEAFHRHRYGALGLTAATEVSYSFVNDVYVWGAFDNMWPDFLPMYGSNPKTRSILPAFANAAGKYFLSQSNWPSNPQQKQITYYLFHHHGDAFTTVFYALPQPLAVSHSPVCFSGQNSFEVTANAGALIALTVDDELIGIATGTGMSELIPIPPQNAGNEITITITKQNHTRYESTVAITVMSGDSNCDGHVGLPDVIITIQYTLGHQPALFCFDNADITGDGLINIMDVIAIVNLIMGFK